MVISEIITSRVEFLKTRKEKIQKMKAVQERQDFVESFIQRHQDLLDEKKRLEKIYNEVTDKESIDLLIMQMNNLDGIINTMQREKKFYKL